MPSCEARNARWSANAQTTDHAVETLELRSGARLILCRFDQGAPRSFSFTEPEDMFGFGFHLRGGARFEMEAKAFRTSALDVWACAAPRGSSSTFILPAEGFRTASIRFEPQVAEEFFAEGLALRRGARRILKRARQAVGTAQMPSLAAGAATRLQSMFTTPYRDAARRLYLESCALDLLAGQVASLSDEAVNEGVAELRHREKAFAARDYLDARLRDTPTIAELAKAVGTNEFTLKRAFKETFGATIFSYVSRKRMEHAAGLLRQGMSVSSAAHEVGYGCARSFSAAFRRQVGRSPSAIRRGVQ